MAVNTSAYFLIPGQHGTGTGFVYKGNNMFPEPPPSVIYGQGTPDGSRAPFTLVNKGTLYMQTNGTDDDTHVWMKVDEAGNDADWVSLALSVPPVVNVTAATLTATLASHSGKTVTINAAAGCAVTLPAATGSGASFRFIIGTTVSSNTTTIKVVGNDVMTGVALSAADTDSSVNGWETAADSDTITLDGSTTGGIKGDVIELIDIAADTWWVHIVSSSTGTEATPFSATVS